MVMTRAQQEIAKAERKYEPGVLSFSQPAAEVGMKIMSLTSPNSLT